MKSGFSFISLLISITVTTNLIAAEANRPVLPNIVLMMADDMGIGDTSAYLGVRMGPKAEPIAHTQRTPQLKAFAQQAVVLTTPTHQPPCVPPRGTHC